MPNERKIVSVHPDGIDDARAKIVRHLYDLVHGRLDVNAIPRGVRCVAHELITTELPNSKIRLNKVTLNAYNIDDLNIGTIELDVPPH